MARRTLSAAVSAAVLGTALVPFAAVPAAHAAGEDLATCMQNQGVWVVVADGKSGCATNPKTGLEALEQIGVKVTKDPKSGFICALDDAHADSCGAKFTGSYWNYATGKPGGQWVYATKGADQAVPQPGTVEGWAWGPDKTFAVMPAAPAATTSAAPTAQPTASPSASEPATAEVSETPREVPWLGLALLGLAALATLALMAALTNGRRTKLDERR